MASRFCSLLAFAAWLRDPFSRPPTPALTNTRYAIDVGCTVAADRCGAQLERFLQPGIDSVMSFYGPVMFPPCPVVVLSPTGGGLPVRAHVSDCAVLTRLLVQDSPTAQHLLVGCGSLLPPSPSRIILRKAVLTGVPIRSHKRYAVVRGMFHTKEDVE